MTSTGWIQLILFVVGLAAITKPMGIYLQRVLDPEQAGGVWFLEKLFGPIERVIYALIGVDRKKQQNWKQYSVALLVFSVITMLVSYAVFRLQDKLPGQAWLNPQKFGPVEQALAFLQSASFMTNTDWQSYVPEATFSYLSQTVGVGLHLFFSSCVGIAVAAVMVRGVVRKQTHLLGNFWVDMTRLVLYLFIPICVPYAIFLCATGSPMNFKAFTTVNAVDQTGAVSATQPAQQTIAQGPMASFLAPKVLGLNGPGFTNANAANTFENGTPLSDYIQVLSFFAIPAGLVYYYGLMVRNRKHAWTCWMVMFVLLMAGLLSIWYFESQPNPRVISMGVSSLNTNMEGKEQRLGIFRSAAMGEFVTATAEGEVNCMHDSFTPMAGFITIFNMHLGEVVFGGIGSGLYTFLIFVFVAVFLAGLMIGRTPEFLGKKIVAYDVKLASLFLLLTVITSLGFTAWAVVSAWGTSGMNNNGPHGYSEVLYAYSSATANNGSAFAGLTCTPSGSQFAGTTPYDQHYNISIAFCLLLGRFFQIIPVLALAGSLAMKKPAPTNAGSFPVTGGTFIILLTCVILIVGALNFFPSLALGPIVEHFVMTHSASTF